MDFDKDTSAGYLINHAARIFAKGLQDRIAPLGLAIGPFPILLELWRKDGVTQRELLIQLDIEQATLANTLARMERDGWIIRRKHPSDSRAQQIWLTPAAINIRDQAYLAANDQNAAALAPLSNDETVLFLDMLRRIIDGAQGNP